MHAEGTFPSLKFCRLVLRIPYYCTAFGEDNKMYDVVDLGLVNGNVDIAMGLTCAWLARAG